ncbi:MAG TPA: class I SAM-dependent methyltransferase [Burkholderiales bacterium]|nr:class I SAM-dependent methyltransferase [Burkholderiales bacterium]
MLVLILPIAAAAQTKPFEPYVGQPGKDVVWVPTPPALVEKMLDLAAVTPRDFVVDLGSGDGRMVIAAAKRGARALGVEYDADMVRLARKNAAEAGVADKAIFVQGDMFEADFRQASVLALFLLPGNLRRLAPRFLELAPGTRIVSNTYKIEGWEEADIAYGEHFCVTWCTAYLYLVPAKVAGAWKLPAGEVRFTQEMQSLSGTLVYPGGRYVSAEGQVKGDHVRFTAGLDTYTGRVRGDEMTGEASGALSGFWRATRLKN